ncbi:MAG TPA: thiamine pyrophosphate-dependent enzyme [Candidatus Magasanikbacteria bacterium]|nr:thiamine pyrophosphate-dependent enzyme [Candidatus Magasanikbacteria bacterium]
MLKIFPSSKVAKHVKIKSAKIAREDREAREKLARILRGYIFASVSSANSGHPGGSSSKADLALGWILSGQVAFDPLRPKYPTHDRVVWSAGHCTPLLHSLQVLIYESLRRTGVKIDAREVVAFSPEDLLKFRRPDGPPGHAENYYPLSDMATGPSGHGLSGAVGLATLHHSTDSGAKVWVFMGDAESEEGMSYEARNLAVSLGLDNLIVTLDYNHFGIDGPIEEVVSSDYLNHWLGLGWNVIEIDGHDVAAVAEAYAQAGRGFGNKRPTVILAHTLKGKDYGAMENTATSHGTVAKLGDYKKIIAKLGFGDAHKETEIGEDIKMITEAITPSLAKYIGGKLRIATKKLVDEQKSVARIVKANKNRPLVSATEIRRPNNLPAELVFPPGEKVSTRAAAQAFFAWLMRESGFVWAGAGDLAKSVLTNKAEEVYGIINAKNKYGRGIRYGIAEQNMAMMGAMLATDRLPGGYRPTSIFSTYAVFTTMTGNCIRLAAINNFLNPDKAGFFIYLASHDGLDVGEDGPTHHGLYWDNFYANLPGVTVMRPFDANETIEMLFSALEKAEPIVLSVGRPNVPVIDRRNHASAREAVNGAYIYRDYDSGRGRKLCLVVSGLIMLENTEKIIGELEARDLNMKIVAVTSAQLFAKYKNTNPEKAQRVFSEEDARIAVTVHAGSRMYLRDFLSGENIESRSIALDSYYPSGRVEEVYEEAGMDSLQLLDKILNVIG